jgi:hypothetical protein
MHAHSPTSTIIAKSVIALVACALTLAMLGTGAVAAAPVVHDRVLSSSGGATNEVCYGTICTATSVFFIVNAPDGPSQACLDITRYERVGPVFNLLGYENGCALLPEGGATVDTKDLASATLSPIDITTQAFTCDATGCQPTGEPRTVPVSATYTGVGDTSSFRSNSKSEFGGCTTYFVGKGSSRQATAILTVDSQSLAAIGGISVSTQKIKVLCQ